MKCRSADRCDGVGSSQDVNPLAIDERMVGPDTLDNRDTSLQTIKTFSVHSHLTAAVAQSNSVTFFYAQHRGILGMEHHTRSALASNGSRRFVERRIQIVPSRSCYQPKWQFVCRLFDNRPMIGKCWRSSSSGAKSAGFEGLPIRSKVKLAVRMRKTIDIMRLGERRLAVNPALLLQVLKGTPTRFL